MTQNLEDYYAQLDTGDDPWENVECRTQDPEMWWRWDERMGALPVFELEELAMALTICNRCPLRMECLQLGIREEHIMHGIFGGLMSGERMKLMNYNQFASYRKMISKAEGIRRKVQPYLEVFENGHTIKD